MDTLQPDEFPHMPQWVDLDDDEEPEAWRINKPIPTLRLFAEQEEDGDFEDEYDDESEP